jgi:mRNA interferase MazF
MNCRRGDVILVLFPDSNLRTSKRRRALVVQADQLGAGLPQTIVATIASNMARAGQASKVVVRVDSESAKGSGLLMDSVIMTGNLATIQYSEIDRILGALSGLRELDAALRAGCRCLCRTDPEVMPVDRRANIQVGTTLHVTGSVGMGQGKRDG